MEDKQAYISIAVICGIVLLLVLSGQRARYLFLFAVRAAAGCVLICLINDLLEKQGIALAVGLNPVSLLTTGTLGISGLALLYGILACNFL